MDCAYKRASVILDMYKHEASYVLGRINPDVSIDNLRELTPRELCDLLELVSSGIDVDHSIPPLIGFLNRHISEKETDRVCAAITTIPDQMLKGMATALDAPKTTAPSSSEAHTSVPDNMMETASKYMIMYNEISKRLNELIVERDNLIVERDSITKQFDASTNARFRRQDEFIAERNSALDAHKELTKTHSETVQKLEAANKEFELKTALLTEVIRQRDESNAKYEAKIMQMARKRVDLIKDRDEKCEQAAGHIDDLIRERDDLLRERDTAIAKRDAFKNDTRVARDKLATLVDNVADLQDQLLTEMIKHAATEQKLAEATDELERMLATAGTCIDTTAVPGVKLSKKQARREAAKLNDQTNALLDEQVRMQAEISEWMDKYQTLSNKHVQLMCCADRNSAELATTRAELATTKEQLSDAESRLDDAWDRIHDGFSGDN